MKIPRVVKIRQQVCLQKVEDVENQLRQQIRSKGFELKVKHGETVAIGCTSRGIPEYPLVVRIIVDELKRMGLRPFLFPAMGSHGASSAEGQAAFLENYGLKEEVVGAPIRSQIEVEDIGRTENLKLSVYIDKLALEADHIVVLNRIKSHTDFYNDFESGIIKILAIGLGKFFGARYYHTAIIRWGFPKVLSDVAAKVLKTGKVLFGVGIVENANNQIADVQVLDTNTFETLLAEESELLKEYYRISPKLPFEEADILVIDQVGKDISGTGMDTKVVGRIYKPLISPEPESPRIKRIIALGLSEHSSRSPGSSGMLDFASRNYDKATDWEAVTVNGIAASMPEFCKKPPIMPTDYATVQAAVDSIGLYDTSEVKLIRILNTGALKEMFVSEAYMPEIAGRDDLEVLSEPMKLPFDEEGTIIPFFKS